jgi:hypothetical protein
MKGHLCGSLSPQTVTERRMPTNVFLSYARKDGSEVEYLERLLRARGIRTWRDLTDLPLGVETESQIETAIAEECDAFVVYLTRASLSSDFIWKVEVPAALTRHRDDPDFAIIPVFHTASTTEVSQLCVDKGLRPITDFNGVVLSQVEPGGNAADVQEGLAEVASRTLRSALPAHFRRIDSDSADEPRISFHSFPFAARTDQLDLDMDWTPFLCRRAASTEEWNTVLLPSLGDVKDALSGLPLMPRVHAMVRARLSALVAFGYTFRASTGFSLAIDSRGVVYSTTAAIPDPAPLEMACELQSGEAGVAVVKVSVSRDVSVPASEYVAGHRLGFSTSLVFEPPGGPSREAVEDPGHALAIAREVGQEIRRLNDEQRADHVHLFIAVPAPIAVLLGYQLNACGRIHLYQRMDGVYTPACVLG